MLSKRNIYSIAIALIIFLIALFVINLVWFRPFFIRHFFKKEMIAALKFDPQLASKANAPFLYRKSRSHLNDISPEALFKRKEHLEDVSEQLSKYNTKFLTSQNALSREIMQWHLTMELESLQFPFHDYPLNPYNGYQVELLSYLESHHRIKNKKDAEAYLERLRHIPDYLDQLKLRVYGSQQAATLPTRHILQQTIEQMEYFISLEPENNLLYLSFRQKIDSVKNIKRKEQLLNESLEIIRQQVYPAYRDLIQFTRPLVLDAKTEIGVGHLPNGEAYFTHILRKNTSLDLSPDSLFNLGIEETWRIKDEMIEQMAELGVDADRRNLIDLIREEINAKELILGNSIQGRLRCQEIIDSLFEVGRSVSASWFTEIPDVELQLDPVPIFRQKHSQNAYYEISTPVSDEPATVFINMEILDDIPVYELPALSFHEGFPGHHFHLAKILNDKSIPLYRKRFYNAGMLEGWAVYAEKLMFESDNYAFKPLERLGSLNFELLRAARMVMDIGIHHKKWTREDASFFLKKNSTMNDKRIAMEVDRITVTPGYASSYTAGYLKLMQLQEKLETELGNTFTKEHFFELILEDGVLPIPVLENKVNQYILEQTAKDES